MDAPVSETPIMLYDGACAMCNGSVRFVFRNDKSRAIHFLALQTDKAAALLAPHGLSNKELFSVIYIKDGKAYLRTEAALRIACQMGGVWRWIGRLGLVFPRALRDVVYDWVARNRIRWFGTQVACELPTPAFRARLLA